MNNLLVIPFRLLISFVLFNKSLAFINSLASKSYLNSFLYYCFPAETLRELILAKSSSKVVFDITKIAFKSEEGW